MKKKNLGQFYTTRAKYIMGDLIKDLPKEIPVIEPFCGNGDLLIFENPFEMYDIDPKKEGCIQRDTLRNPPNYEGKLVITNPPYLAKNKSEDKEIYEKYNVGDLYKASILSIMECDGGILIIPLNFFCDEDDEIRKVFFKRFQVVSLKVFEETVFDDTAYTICAFSFLPRLSKKTSLKIKFFPSEYEEKFDVEEETGYRIGSEFFKIVNNQRSIGVSRLLKGEVSTSKIFLRAIDTGSNEGRISLSISNDTYYGEKSDRVFATIKTPIEYTEEVQKKIVKEFNDFLEENRKIYRSMFLTNYRNSSSSYSRKRISFDVAYKIISYIIEKEGIPTDKVKKSLW
jgi:hypothetical protein